MTEPTAVTADTCPRCGMIALHNTVYTNEQYYCVNGHKWRASGAPVSDDPINPPHYQQGEVEAIDGIRSALGAGFSAYLRGNILKYIWRLEHKGGLEDARKAAWYCQRLVEVLSAG